MIEEADSLDGLSGVEGMAARRYFEGIAALLPDDLGFEGRNRRPPRDVANAALSYGYSILLSAAVTAIRIAGLDPYAGFLHSDAHNRPSLALDLMEEFRPVLVDAAVLTLFRRGSMSSGSARSEEKRSGVLLIEQARKTLTSTIEDRLLTVSYHEPAKGRVSRRRQMILQAQRLARSIDQGIVEYEPVRWR